MVRLHSRAGSRMSKKLIQAAAGGAGESVYVEDVFSTYLYTGTGSAQSIDNGIPLSDEGGLVWIKSRSNADSHYLFDTVNGPEETLSSDNTNAGANYSAYWDFPSAGTTGFNLKAAPGNYSGWTMASWSFRKAEKFFDVVTYTGDGVAGKTVAHNLGSVPAVMIIKRTSTAGSNWRVYHTSLGNGQALSLNTNDAAGATTSLWNSTTPTDSVFTLGDNGNVNQSGQSFVAYLFASDAGGFGDDGSESIIKCDSFTVSGGAASIDLGWEPQFVVTKNVTGTGAWFVFDNMRGMAVGTGDPYLRPDSSNAESSGTTNFIDLTPTGFEINNLGSTQTFIYIAIRRPMKTPESGTEVFAIDTPSGTSAGDILTSGFVDDIIFQKYRTLTSGFKTAPRLTGNGVLDLSKTDAENTSQNRYAFDVQNGVELVLGDGAYDMLYYHFKRATGFFDVVAYTGDGTAGTTYTHNLSVAPEMMIVKVRSIAEPWVVYHTGLNGGVTPQNYHIRLTDGVEAADSDIWNNTAPTSSVFTTGGNDKVNRNTDTYIAYLFATLAGVSKIGSYTGTAADLNVDCGFSAGARFILIKRTDSTGDWYVWDSERGIVAGNDPYLLLNSTAAEVTSTDYIDPLNAGFTVTSSAPAALNASSGTYIFLAIA